MTQFTFLLVFLILFILYERKVFIRIPQIIFWKRKKSQPNYVTANRFYSQKEETRKSIESLRVLVDRITLYSITNDINFLEYRKPLLIEEANNRGFFTKDFYFNTVGDFFKEDAYFQMDFNLIYRIPDNLYYNEKEDSLMVPAIGVKGNMSNCKVTIYKNGRWAKVYTKENKELKID